MNHKYKHKNKIQLFIIFLLIGVTFSILSYFVSYHLDCKAIYKKYQNLASTEIITKSLQINQTIDRAKATLSSMVENSDVQKFILAGEHRIEIENIFKLINDSNRDYLKIRFVDSNGVEKIKVNKIDSKSVISHDLQDKSFKEFFLATSKLQKGEFFVSDFDLSAERDEIELPIKPMIRVSTPIYLNEKFQGVLIVNILVKELFEKLEISENFDFYIYDSEGFYLLHKYNRFSWSRFFSNYKITDEFKEIDAFSREFISDKFISQRLIYPNIYFLLIIKDNVINVEVQHLKDQLILNLFNFLIVSILLVFIASLVPEKLYKQALEQEQEIEQNMALINRYIIYSKTDINGIITEVSNAFCELCGYSRNELIGRNHSILKSNRENKDTYKNMWFSIASGNLWQGELTNRKKDGSIYAIFITISEIKDNATNQRSGYISICQDITAKKSLQESKLQLLRQSRHSAMGEMISIIAHQWRQPINYLGIKIFAFTNDFIQDRLTKDKANQVYEECANTLDEMSKIIDDFRDFFKPDKPKEAFEPELAVQKSITLLSHLIFGSNIEIEIDNQSEDKIFCVLNELVQVFINFIKNSYDEFMSKNIRSPKIKIDIKSDNGFVYINYYDNAGGVNEAFLNKIFEPYFSTKSENGTGIGLYMCKLILEESMNAEISFENHLDGVKISLKIPISNHKIDNSIK